MSDFAVDKDVTNRSKRYAGPNLSPVGLELVPQRVAPDVYALMANIPPKNNSGLVAGSRAALVIDAGITEDVSLMIRQRVASLTEKPLRYLVNTTYHGDHTFGNAGFPEDVVIVTSRANRENMTDMDDEKSMRGRNMYGHEDLLDRLPPWRRPDLVVDTYAGIDLGDRLVELHHFGPGNGPGDVIVHVPSAAAAWTGNYLCREGTAHLVPRSGPKPYIASAKRMRETLPRKTTIVPGHGPTGNCHAALDSLITYLERLDEEVGAAHSAGRTLDETLAFCTDPWADSLDPGLAAALSSYRSSEPPTAERFRELCRNVHRLNVRATYALYDVTIARS